MRTAAPRVKSAAVRVFRVVFARVARTLMMLSAARMARVSRL
jgi:hypothetical protein